MYVFIFKVIYLKNFGLGIKKTEWEYVLDPIKTYVQDTTNIFLLETELLYF